ncbi:MAG: hypothetical protein M3081_09850 [Gemmatimonadota bacterium]|nr:hypothetical protein [Gemmatimonadota bacterium]
MAVQDDDAALAALDIRTKAFDTKTQGLDRERATAADVVERVRTQITAEEKRQRDLQQTIDEHKQAQEHNVGQLDAVRKQREATAAMSQIDVMRKALATEESEMHSIVARLQEQRLALIAREADLGEMDERQQAARAEIEQGRQALNKEIAEAKAKRAAAAAKVSKAMLAKYEKIRIRQGHGALFAIRNAACSHCNTAIPLQRRNVIAGGKSIEVCEGCGVLLYATV